MNTLIYPRGTPLLFTYGEYSDFGVIASIVTIQDCDLPKLSRQFIAEHKPEYEWDKADQHDFAGWLIANGYAMPMTVEEVHLGEYREWPREFTDEV